MPARRRRSGFTLIELLVVIIIIATVTAVAMLSFGLLGNERALEEEARRLRSLVELAEDEALMQGREFGLEFMRTGYRFVEYDPLTNRWAELVDDDLLRPRTLEEGVTFELFLEDRPVELKDRPMRIKPPEDEDEGEDEEDGDGYRTRGDDDEDDYAPHVLIMSSGEITPFDLTIFRDADDAEVLLAMNEAGQLEIATDAEASR
jgi:general secretion pathway protein H